MENLTVDHVLDTIRARHSLKSDYQLCKLTDISTPLVSGWRHGKSLPDERMCKRLAEAAGIDPLVLAASMQAQRSKTIEARSMWEAIAERLQMGAHGLAAAIFAVVLALSLGAEEAQAETLSGQVVAVLSGSTGYTSYLVMVTQTRVGNHLPLWTTQHWCRHGFCQFVHATTSRQVFDLPAQLAA